MQNFKYRLENQLDFTHPYMTINQMKKMIEQNYIKVRDNYGYSTPAFEMINNLEMQAYALIGDFENGTSLRLPILVFPIPTDEMWKPVKYGFIQKLEANGETIVYSPVRLPFLDNRRIDS